MFTILEAHSWASQVVLVVKNPSANAEDTRDTGLIPGSGRSPGGGNGNPVQYLCLEKSMDRRAQRAAVHGISQRWTLPKPFSTQYTHINKGSYLVLSNSKAWFLPPLLPHPRQTLTPSVLSPPSQTDPSIQHVHSCLWTIAAAVPSIKTFP